MNKEEKYWANIKKKEKQNGYVILDKQDNNRLEIIAKEVGDNNLDIGCNQTPNPFLRNTVGLDIKKTKNKPDNYKKVYVYDGDKLPFPDNRFDSITAGELIEHINNVGSFLKECYRVLKPNGKLVLSTPNLYYLSEIIYEILPIKGDPSPEHVILFARNTMRRSLKYNNFKLLKTISNGAVIPVLGWHFKFSFTDFLTNHFIYVCEVEKKDES